MSKDSLEDLRIVTGSVYPEFAQEVADTLGVEMSPVTLKRHANTEQYIRYEESVRTQHLFVLQTHAAVGDRSVDDAVAEHRMLGSAARRASAPRITACFPYMAYSRQERKSKSGEPIAAADLVHDFDASGYERQISVDLHAGAIQGFTGRPFDHMTAAPVLRDRLKDWVDEHGRKNVILVAPDAGRTKAVADMAEQLDIKYATVDKRRDKRTGKSTAKKVVGNVAGRHAMLYDDMIDGGGTLKGAAERLIEKKAVSVGAIATHGILSAAAPENIKDSPLDVVIVTNTLPQDEHQAQIPKLEVVSIVPMMAEAVSRVHRKKSLSKLFDGLNQS